jgi:hypothetical protein
VTLEGIKDPFAETSASLDSNDTRMQQTTWVNGALWGAIDTGLSTSNAKQAGIEWFMVSPSTSTGSVTATLANSGYVGLGNDNLTYPAIGITSGGTGVMGVTWWSDFYPSAGYALVTPSGVGDHSHCGGRAGPRRRLHELQAHSATRRARPGPAGETRRGCPGGQQCLDRLEYIARPAPSAST